MSRSKIALWTVLLLLIMAIGFALVVKATGLHYERDPLPGPTGPKTPGEITPSRPQIAPPEG